MQNNLAAKEARSRLGHELTVATHLYGVTVAVRALISTHPEPEKLRTAFDQLIGQMLSHPGFLENPDQGIVLRDMAETLFQPPVVL